MCSWDSAALGTNRDRTPNFDQGGVLIRGIVDPIIQQGLRLRSQLCGERLTVDLVGQQLIDQRSPNLFADQAVGGVAKLGNGFAARQHVVNVGQTLGVGEDGIAHRICK